MAKSIDVYRTYFNKEELRRANAEWFSYNSGINGKVCCLKKY